MWRWLPSWKKNHNCWLACHIETMPRKKTTRTNVYKQIYIFSCKLRFLFCYEAYSIQNKIYSWVSINFDRCYYNFVHVSSKTYLPTNYKGSECQTSVGAETHRSFGWFYDWCLSYFTRFSLTLRYTLRQMHELFCVCIKWNRGIYMFVFRYSGDL